MFLLDLDLREFLQGEDSSSMINSVQNDSLAFHFSKDGWMIREFGQNIPTKMFYYSENECTTMYIKQSDGVYYCYLYDGNTVYYTTESIINFSIDNLYFEKLTSSMEPSVRLELSMLELFLKKFYVKRCFHYNTTLDEVNIESSSAKAFTIVENTPKNIICNIHAYGPIGKWVITNCSYAYDIEE